MNSITIHSENQLNKAVTFILPFLEKHKVVAFYGSMGVGKTTFIKALCKQIGVTDPVSSPTFSLINEYNTATGNPVFHFDFYRINKPEEAYDFGYEDYFFSNELCFIEWPEKITELLPQNTLSVNINEEPDGSRTFTVKN